LSEIVIVRGGLVVADADGQFRIAFVELGLVDRLETQLVAGVGGVRDELAQEDLRLLYSEWIISCSSCLTSVWKPSVSFMWPMSVRIVGK